MGPLDLSELSAGQVQIESSSPEVQAQCGNVSPGNFSAMAGGRFRTVDTPLGPRNLFYVTGAAGLLVIDATIPRVPVVVGSPCPHFENEDVDFGGNTLLISADGLTGSALFVIDIAVPAAPYLKARLQVHQLPRQMGSAWRSRSYR